MLENGSVVEYPVHSGKSTVLARVVAKEGEDVFVQPLGTDATVRIPSMWVEPYLGDTSYINPVRFVDTVQLSACVGATVGHILDEWIRHRATPEELDTWERGDILQRAKLLQELYIHRLNLPDE